ncbi:MAG: helix-turn-helix domain-containing protein [Treponema sp.]|jgi:transcriptional regulator with XRE-family HTH domain|nr:helix-turn-helix domain-containing protein [Treponema sp.]
MKEHINEEDIRILVSKNLKRIRNLQNISQFGLGLKSGLTHNFINDIENGKKGISCKSLSKLSTALMVEPFQFFLPESVPDDGFSGYAHDLNDSFHKAVENVMSRYLPEKSGKNEPQHE